MCYITNTQNSEDQNQQRNYARFFAPNQNYQYQFALPLNGKPIAEYQDESSDNYDSQEQYQYGYIPQQQQHVVYLDSKPFNQYGFNGQNAPVNENEIFNILGPINENNEEQQIQENGEYSGAYSELAYNQCFNDSESPFVYAKNEEEEGYFQPQQYQEVNNFNTYEAPFYNNNSNNVNNMIAPQTVPEQQVSYAQPEFNQEIQFYPQQQTQYATQNFEPVNDYSFQMPQQQFPQMNDIPMQQQNNFTAEEVSPAQKEQCKREISSSSDLCNEDDNNCKYEDGINEDFDDDGADEQNEIIDKIKKSNKKNVVKNIMSAFKRFIQDIQTDPSQSSSPCTLDSSCSLSSSAITTNTNSKPSKISNLKQNITSSDGYHIDVIFERDNVLSIYNNSKTKPDSIEEMGKKFKRYISSKQFNHYTIRLLVQHQNYGQIFKYFLENHANNWLSKSKVDDPYGHKIMIEFLMAAYEDINVIEKLKKHEKRKAIYQ